MQLALAFLLGIATALLGVRLWEARQTQPLDSFFRTSYRLDLNHASPNELAQLPRVGPAMADRIVDSRPFGKVDELSRVPGVGPATRDRILPHVTIGESPLTAVNRPIEKTQSIDPNSATLDELQTLPGIGPKMAQRIVDERARRPFISVEDMRRVSGIGPKTLERLRGRIRFSEAQNQDRR